MLSGPLCAFFVAPGAFGDDDFFKLSHLVHVGVDVADFGFGGLFFRAVDGRSGKGLAPYTLTRHLYRVKWLQS